MVKKKFYINKYQISFIKIMYMYVNFCLPIFKFSRFSTKLCLDIFTRCDSSLSQGVILLMTPTDSIPLHSGQRNLLSLSRHKAQKKRALMPYAGNESPE